MKVILEMPILMTYLLNIIKGCLVYHGEDIDLDVGY